MHLTDGIKIVSSKLPQSALINVAILFDQHLPSQEDKLQKIIESNQNVFSKHKYDIGKISTPQCELNLKDEIPICCRPYPCTRMDQELINETIKNLLEYDIIEKSCSPYAFPFVLVDKKDVGKKSRMCVDFRKLNVVTIDERYPMPLLRD